MTVGEKVEYRPQGKEDFEEIQCLKVGQKATIGGHDRTAIIFIVSESSMA